MVKEDAKTQGGTQMKRGGEENIKISKKARLHIFENIHFLNLEYSDHLGCNCEDPMLLNDVKRELWPRVPILANMST